jgi:RNA polymerase sigma-70 factor (ECF subfamily)
MVDEVVNINDEVLASLIRQNDKEAFKLLYNRYSKKIYFFSLRYLCNDIEAEELVQSVFINIWEYRESLDPASSVKSYIYKSAVNYIYNYLKKKAIRARFIESEFNKGEIHSNHTYEQVFFHDLERSVNNIVENLPSQQQKIFHLSRYEGLTTKEIAKKLFLSERTVENQIYRSLKIIKNTLRGAIVFALMLI